MQPDSASHRIARVAAHLSPSPRPQMEEGVRPAPCRAKGGAPGFKVAVLGAAGGIGQPLSLLMKLNPLVSVLHLYDVVNTPGVTASDQTTCCSRPTRPSAPTTTTTTTAS